MIFTRTRCLHCNVLLDSLYRSGFLITDLVLLFVMKIVYYYIEINC